MNFAKLTLLPLFLSNLGLHRSAQAQPIDAQMIEAPGIEQKGLVAPIADVFDKIAPAKGDWDTEGYSEAASSQLYKLTAAIKTSKFDELSLKGIIDDSFQSSMLVPETASMEVMQKQGFEVHTWKRPSEIVTNQNIEQLFKSFNTAFSPDQKKEISTKIFKRPLFRLVAFSCPKIIL